MANPYARQSGAVMNTDADYLAATNQTPDDGLHIARVPLSG